MVKAEQSIAEFFLAEAAHSDTPAPFSPHGSADELYAFELLGSINGAGAVNLGLHRGYSVTHLGCDQPWPRVSPETGASTYTFEVWPHSHLPDLHWQHIQGQVEIDALYVAHRSGKAALFVVEAKHGHPSALATTKPADACSAIATKRVPADLPIIPVYLRSWQEPHGQVRFCTTECLVWNRERPYVTDIGAVSTHFFEIGVG